MADKANLEEVSLLDKRLRSLTEKASENFESTCTAHNGKLIYSSKCVNELTTHVYGDFDNIGALDDLHQRLKEERDHFPA